MIRNINCFTATCERCVNRVFVKKNYWGDKLYICPHNPNKHKAISADDCGFFRCDGNDFSILCEDCSRGYLTKKRTK